MSKLKIIHHFPTEEITEEAEIIEASVTFDFESRDVDVKIKASSWGLEDAKRRVFDVLKPTDTSPTDNTW